jgi:ribose transport system permease protein
MTNPWATVRMTFGSRAPRLPKASSLILAYVLLAISIAVVDPGFFGGSNLESVLESNAGLAVTTVGMTFVIITGAYDLSVGGVAGLAGVVYAKVALNHSIPEAIAIALLAGLACGVVNGFSVAWLRINAFMATFATSLVFLGLALAIQGDQEIVVGNRGFGSVGLASWGGVPVAIVFVVAAFVLGGVLLQGTKFGQNVYAIGSNREGARLVGIQVNRVWAMTFVICAVLSAFAGVLIAAQVGVGSQNSGSQLTIEAIAAVVIGGVSVYGGEGKMFQAALGLVILAALSSLFVRLSWSVQAQDIVEGIVILLALGANTVQTRSAAVV